MTDTPKPAPDQPPTPGQPTPAGQAAPAPAAPPPAARPRGMTYGGISAAQHAMERQERAGLWRKNGRRAGP